MKRSPDRGPAIRSEGPWPFKTRHRFVRGGHHLIWRSRQNRKGLLRAERGQKGHLAPLWQRQSYNRLIGVLFSIGAALFMLGVGLSLFPFAAGTGPTPQQIGWVFFAGSTPFTVAAYLQLFQAANAPAFRPDADAGAARNGIAFVGWYPDNPGWLSTLAQFVGTVAFNFNTFDAIDPGADWLREDLTIWLPGLIGSVLFLVSGWLAFIETCHAHWAWLPHEIDWQIAAVNFLGCIVFLTAGVLSYRRAKRLTRLGFSGLPDL